MCMYLVSIGSHLSLPIAHNAHILAASIAAADHSIRFSDWGQNSYGAANPTDKKNWQQPLRYYCEDDSIDVLPVSFLTTFFSTGGKPTINLANYCNSVDNSTFPGTQLADCSGMEDDIRYCQQRGKAITLSLGGATGGVGFSSDDQANAFADTLWNDFLGGTSTTRPFGNVSLDGIDLDIEGGGAAHYPVFLRKLKTYFDGADKKYYITAAPQCVFPDANLQQTMNDFPMDAVYVQFYNNPCGLQTYGKASQWNFGMWDHWARNVSPNKDVKIYIGAPASSSAAGGGYVPLATLAKIVNDTRHSFPSFGGVMYWDASQARANGRMDSGIKGIMGNTCNGGFEYPPCDAPTWDHSGRLYTAGNRVSHKYIWEAKWSASAEPKANPMGEWAPVKACQANGSPPNIPSIPIHQSPSSSASVPTQKPLPSTSSNANTSNTMNNAPPSSVKPTSLGRPNATTATPTPLPPQTTQQTQPTGNPCNTLPLWSPSSTYTGGSKVVYQQKVWSAAWWTYGDVPGGAAGVWSMEKACP
ncbi:hypothetical protein O0I10_007959 [Lichtheimia ornata]|uniref:chitinase n=1 Tax=Lichtheimia ornata TaxID=688661 RepID=A0AAD7XXF2_9FUNG|nr:uncharacterized protein O0I10_007959 [Lichtheimia ornata]KAJ8656391.1 hypothetical protein O0I10_007959 [Lichtheimia ornata]